jgi:hypothetical protein
VERYPTFFVLNRLSTQGAGVAAALRRAVLRTHKIGKENGTRVQQQCERVMQAHCMQTRECTGNSVNGTSSTNLLGEELLEEARDGLALRRFDLVLSKNGRDQANDKPT